MTGQSVIVGWSVSGALPTALLASLALGVVSGLLGTFVVLRRESLFGDALSHAVFPGVVVGFLASEWLERAGHITGDKNPLVILSCAMAAGLAGAFVVYLLQQTTRLKQDASLGIVLSVFFALGIGLYTVGQPAGVQGFFYGQTAAIDGRDLVLMLAAALLVSVVVLVFRRPLLVVSFDCGYARNLGYPVGLLTLLFSGLLTVAVVVAMQAVGVILVSALLITPAATAHLLTDRFPRMMGLAVGVAVGAGVLGSVISSRVNGLPTGPVIALCAAGLFAATYLGAPRYGVLARLLRDARQRRNIGRENSLKDLSLTNEAAYQTDHVHDDAEIVEHLLGENAIRRLEQELGFPQTDPHGSPIPVPGPEPAHPER